jgi:hypothetical protein
VERLAATEPGRVELSGRWFGVRGRRFMRPALTLVAAADGSEHHALAELDDKPWAVQDGEPWRASFPVDVALEHAASIQLTVAPDIVVWLRGHDGAAPPAPRRSARAAARDAERLRISLDAAEQALDAEREHRAIAEGKLDEERAEGRRLRAELGRLRAELEIAGAARAEAGVAEAELEAARRELQAAQRRHELLRREHREVIDARGRDRAALDDRSGALASAREALAQERATSGQLRAQLAGTPTETWTVAERESAGDSAEQALPLLPDRHHGPRPRPPVAAPARRPESFELRPRPRPLNPSLRHRTYWLGRVLALLVLLAVIAAVVLVVRSTIKP